MSPSHPNTKRGFSLIELLVVIAIIAVLVAMLLPSLAGGRIKAKGIICFGNIRTLTVANTQYSSDNNGFLPRPNWGFSGLGWLYRDNKLDKIEDLQGGDLWPYIKEYGAYRCGADEAPAPNDYTTVKWRPRNSRMITSYCMNGSVSRYSGSHKTYRISQFKHDDIIFWEPDENSNNIGDWWDGSNSPNQGLSGRHSALGTRYEDYNTDFTVKGTVGNIDGTAEWMLRRDNLPNTDDFYEISVTDPRNNRLWNVPAPLPP